MEKSGKSDSHHGVKAGGANKNTGTDDDEDLNRSGVDRGGGSFGLGAPQTIRRIRIEPVRRKTTHRRHQQLHARQNGVVSGITDLVGNTVPSVLPSIVKTGEYIATTLPTLTSSSSSLIPGLSILSIPSSPPGTVVPSTSPSDSTDYPNVPVGSTQQTVLSSIPPSSAETSPGMKTPPITISDIISTSLLRAESPSPSSASLSSPTIVLPPSATVTSYWPSLITKNGTTTSDTRPASSITIDGSVIVYTLAPSPTDINNSTFSRNVTSSSTSLSSTSGWSLNSTTTTASSTTSSTSSSLSYSSESLWPTATDVGGGGSGGGGGGVAPTDTAPSGSPTPTEGSGGGGAPVSPKLLGGVLGGVAGIALILLAILYFVRRHKRELAIQARDDAGYGGPVEPARDQPVAAVPGEIGFYKIAGRRLPPVIGGPRPAEFSSTRSAAGSSRYPDDEISWIGPGTPVSSTGAGPSKHSGVSGAAPSSLATSSAPGSTTTPIGPAPTLPPIGTTISAGPSRIPEERESDPELASPGGESMPPPPLPPPPPIAKTPSAPGSQTDLSLTSPTRPPFSRGMSSVSVGSAGSGKEGRAVGEAPPSAGPSVPPAFARQMSAERVGSAGKDGVGRSLPSHDGSRASRFTEDIV